MQVLFCSTENGRSSFVRQLEPDWHIDTNPEIVSQLAVCYSISQLYSASQSSCADINIITIYSFLFEATISSSNSLCLLMINNKSCCRGLSSINFMYLPLELNELRLMCSALHPWNSSLDPCKTQTSTNRMLFINFY